MQDEPAAEAGEMGREPETRPASQTERVLIASLRLALIPVVFLILAAMGAFAYGIAQFVDGLRSVAAHPFPVGHQIGLFLLDIDLFLIGATLLISAIGFYELFIREIPRDTAAMPGWLAMRDLNDLKGRVASMIVLVLAVSFAEAAVDFSDGLQLIELGGASAVIIAALTVFVRLTSH